MVETQLGTFYHYNSRNPTGHYKLSLSTRLERLVALRCIETNGSERYLSIVANAPDCSQHGNRQNIRNGVYNGEAFVYQGDWELPESGVLEFDYVSTHHPPADCRTMSDQELYGKGMKYKEDGSVVFGQNGFWHKYVRPEVTKEILQQAHDAFEMADADGSGQCSIDELKGILKTTGFQLTPEEMHEFVRRADEDGSGEINFEEFLPLYQELVTNLQMEGRLKALRRVSSKQYFKAKQGAQIILDFEHSHQRVECFTILYCRIEVEENLNLMLAVMTNKEKLQLVRVLLTTHEQPREYYFHLRFSWQL